MLTAARLLEELLMRARRVAGSDQVPLAESLGRVLAATQTSRITVPPLDNSAMDGYAIRTADGCGARPISQRILAGQVGVALQPGSAARIFTGAPLPPGADAVAMQEDCVVAEGQVSVNTLPRVGENIRRAGEDIVAGAAILAAGQRIGAAEMGLAASVGLATLPLWRRLRVACFFTGDELVAPGEDLQPSQIYNSNRYTLTGLIQGLGCELIDMGIVPDSLAATTEALRHAASVADVVVTSGGVSVGEADYVKAAVETLGTIDMWQVAMKPGKPLVYGRVNDADFIGLPGNPVSALVTFCLFVRPFLLTRMGANKGLYPRFRQAGFDWRRPGQRREFLRAQIQADGRASIFPNQSSGVLTSCTWADGLIDIDIGQTVQVGDWVRFIPFSELVG
jgi:molybdenum cofactor synthesis domain